ncbi:hypothetical protein [Oleiharenicola sp. Vm1]|uniref:hypothetical protein n=1 Tax=Oleiharenicola sp. Vm1 TaxID=3398393 RepID=UPI0039F5B0BD
MDNILEWVTKHAFTLVIIAGVVAQLIKAIRGQKDTDDAPPAAAPEDKPFEDPELAERTRRIREDIQRRIAERRRGAAGYEPSAAPPPVPDPEAAFEEAPPPLVREVVVERTPNGRAPPSRAPRPSGRRRFSSSRRRWPRRCANSS